MDILGSSFFFGSIRTLSNVNSCNFHKNGLNCVLRYQTVPCWGGGVKLLGHFFALFVLKITDKCIRFSLRTFRYRLYYIVFIYFWALLLCSHLAESKQGRDGAMWVLSVILSCVTHFITADRVFTITLPEHI